MDELWSFVLKKTNQAWIWIALCRKTRQVVAYAVGNHYGIAVYVDKHLTEDESIVFPIGTHTDTMSLKYADFE